jgi:hypothetical protein
MPATLALEVRRVAKERKVTISHALVTLAAQGLEAEAAARARLASAYEGFMSDLDPAKLDQAKLDPAKLDQAKRNESGRELIQAIFGKDAIAEDSLR